MIGIYAGTEATQHLQTILSRTTDMDNPLTERVSAILKQVRHNGDSALRDLAIQFGDKAPEMFRLPASEIEAAIERLPSETRRILKRAAQNIRFFGQAIVDRCQPIALEHEGFQIGLDFKPVERVACYVPGGRYPLPSTALMTAITAKVAGVPHIAIVSPVLKDAVIYAGSLAGVTHFYQLGGAQAVAAMAYGTETIAAVDMVVGPGNAYVTEAKRQLQGTIGIDMLAGPSEVGILADAHANPYWVAVDMLAQAEHDPDARTYLFTNSASLAESVAHELERLQTTLSLPAFVHEAVDASAIFVFETLEKAIDAANQIAPEHLELQVADPKAIKSLLHHYGALFMGYDATVPFGDYLAGPNHTLPTNRAARFGGGLTPLTFLRPQSWIQPGDGLESLAQDTADFATLEGLTAHAAAAAARLSP